MKEALLKKPEHRGTEDEQLLKKFPDGDKEKGATIVTTCINLLKNMVGAGLLNVPVAFMYSSVLGGLLDMILSSFLATGGFLLIGYCCSKTGARSYRALMSVSVGPACGKLIDVMLFFHTLFSCVGYITLIGDFTTKSMSGLAPGSIFATNRAFSTCCIVLTVIFPLSLLRDLKSLKPFSAMGLAAIWFSVVYVFYELFATAEEHQPMQTLKDNWWYVKFDTFKTIALFNGSFSAHYSAPTFYAELRQKSFARYATCALWSFGISTVLFTLFGVAGYARFGNEVLGNILKGYDPESIPVQMSWMCMNIATIFVFPIAFQRMRASWTALVNKPLGLSASSAIPWTTIGLLAASTYFGIAFTDIAVVKLIKGATLGVSIMFIMPGLAFLGISSKGNNRKEFERHFSPAMQRQISPTTEEMPNENTAGIRAFSYVLVTVGILQGLFALLSHFKLI
jgi:sodium-coupled neutral amino acid transporter 11